MKQRSHNIIIFLNICLICVMYWSLVAAADAEEAEKYLKGTSNKELIKLTAAIYNTSPQSREDKVARRVALERIIRTARKRRSPEIEKSGILDYKYEKISIDKWPTEKLRDLYGTLRKEHKEIYWDEFPYLLSREKAFLFSREITMETASRLIMPKSGGREAFRGSWWR